MEGTFMYMKKKYGKEREKLLVDIMLHDYLIEQSNLF